MKNHKLIKIQDVAATLNISDDYLELYGNYIAKLKLELLDKPSSTLGKLILVTAITPTSYGEGKTVTSIGLSQALNKIGKKAIVTLRQPSLGPFFGVKGGATGGGNSQVLPSEKINLGLTGDFFNISSAHNLLAAMIDSHIHHGNELKVDLHNIFWPRTMDMNDRALREIIIGLGGKANGLPRESQFVITATSEIMAILALATSYIDLRGRLEKIIIGLDKNGKELKAKDFQAVGAMMLLLSESFLPNLVQTSENTPALVHTGPFANIAHGTASVISQKIALNLADYVVNETGFGADLGLEKYLDIVMPSSNLKPDLAVLVVSVKALAEQGGWGKTTQDKVVALEIGLNTNLARHLKNITKFNLPVVIAINRFPDDTLAELEQIQVFCKAQNIDSAISEVFEQGGGGGKELAELVVKVASKTNSTKARSLYSNSFSLLEKISCLATEIYGAESVSIENQAKYKLDKFTQMGFSDLPICMAKTPLSFSDNPKLLGAPNGWRLTINDASLSAGAGFIVTMAGNITLMPGLPKTPQATQLDFYPRNNTR
ncbi:MAG: formate--tetrahydrofolate ligase [Acidobacteria bacterium]|nr:formate--tetrahydrofolate ligase [Acidobacteriota bacterium]